MGEINHVGAEKRGFLLNIDMYIKWAQPTFLYFSGILKLNKTKLLVTI
jgi:hypothetical protein